jgi:hypothetical protein
MAANLKDVTQHELIERMLAQQIKTNELLRAMLTQLQQLPHTPKPKTDRELFGLEP